MIASRPVPSTPSIVVASSEATELKADAEPFTLRLAASSGTERRRESAFESFFVGRSRMKRGFDVGLVLLVLPLLVPVMALIAMAIRWDSAGPILLFQRRVGRHGSIFKMWKFRSMVVGADVKLERYLSENPQARIEWNETQKLRFDPRVTKLGRFLRRTSLDELPQLWNVLCGEMSLVGPRPIVSEEISRYEAVYPLYMQSRPGLTGLWQVSGRSNVSYSRRIVLDKIYIRRWSMKMDLRILLRTIPAVLFGRGAY